MLLRRAGSSAQCLPINWLCRCGHTPTLVAGDRCQNWWSEFIGPVNNGTGLDGERDTIAHNNLPVNNHMAYIATTRGSNNGNMRVKYWRERWRKCIEHNKVGILANFE